MENKIELDIIIVPESEGEDRLYSITSIQVPSVVTQGKNIEEAKNRLKEALELYFEEAPEEKTRLIQIVQKEDNSPMISRMFL